MNWRLDTSSFDLWEDVAAVDGVFREMARSAGVAPQSISYSFVHNVPVMLKLSREIEHAIHGQGSGTLYAGFQNAEKIQRELGHYRKIRAAGVRVVAFGSDALGDQMRDAVDTWVMVPEDQTLLQNQWFLVSESPEPVAFVGWEVSGPDTWGKRELTYRDKRFAGFVTKDADVVRLIVRELEESAS